MKDKCFFVFFSRNHFLKMSFMLYFNGGQGGGEGVALFGSGIGSDGREGFKKNL